MNGINLKNKIVPLLIGLSMVLTQAADKDALEKQLNEKTTQPTAKAESRTKLGHVGEFVSKSENASDIESVFIDQEPIPPGYKVQPQPADGIRYTKERPKGKDLKNNAHVKRGFVSTASVTKNDADESAIENVLNKHLNGLPLNAAETTILKANINKVTVENTAGTRRTSISGQRRISRDASDLFFSEYAEGSSNNKYLEIYNGTGAAIDLSNYLIMQNSNGGPWDEYVDTLSGTLANGDVYVIANASADASILAVADLTGSGICYFNGDDARALIKVVAGDTTVLDYIGSFPDDPGSGWGVAGVTDATKNHTLVRKSPITSGNTTWAVSAGTNATDSEWVVHDQNTWSYVGSHTMTEPNPLSEGFEGGAIPENWNVINNDNNTNAWNVLHSAWYAHSGDYSARVYYNNSGSDDWLITPKLDVASGDSIVFWAKSYSSSTPEDFNVKVSSTVNNSVAAFTGTLASVTSASDDWTRYAYALSSYADQDIYVGIQCVTVNGYYLYADDFSGPQVWIDDGPVASFNTSSVDFGNTGTGGMSFPVVVGNLGASDLVISNIAIANTDFSVSAATATLTGGGSDTETISVIYAPTAVAEDTSYVVFTHNGSSSPDSIKVIGAGKETIYWQDFESWGAELFVAEPQPFGMTQEGNMTWSGDGAANGWEKTNSSSAVFAGEFGAEFDSYEGSSAGTDTSAFITPAIEYTTTSISAVEGALRFYMKKRGTEEFYVAYSSDAGNTWTKEYSDTTENYGSGSVGWINVSVEVPLGGTYIFKLVGRANRQSVLGDVFVDEITFVEVPPTPELSLTYSAVGFMPQVIGDSTSSRALTVGLNSGSATLVVDSIVTSNADFSVTLTEMASGSSIEPGGNVDLDLVWSPTSFGLAKTNSVIFHNADTSPDTIVFSGEAGRSYVSFDDNDNFQGAAFDGSLPWLWTITDDDGDGDSWLFNYSYYGPGYTGDPVGYYARSLGGGNSLETRALLPVAGDSLIFYYNSSNSADSSYLRVQAKELGIHNQYSHLDSLRFSGYSNRRAAIDLSPYVGDTIVVKMDDDATYNDYNYHRLDDVFLPMYETSSAGLLVLGQEEIDFGSIHPTTTASITITVANMGITDLTISSVVSDNATFTATLASSTMEAEAATELTVTFSPTVGGLQSGSIILLHDAPSSPDTLGLSGAGYSPTGGPDGFGYSWSNSFSPDGPNFSWVDTSGATSTGIANGDDYRGTVALPFSFRFYGYYYDYITVTTNGWIGMGPYTDYASSYWTNSPIPQSAAPNNLIAALWDDWKAGGSYPAGDILTKTIGTAPNRQFVVIFHEFVRSSSDVDYYSFEVILDETSGDISIQYLDAVGTSSYANNGVGATVGIENGDGDEGLLVSYNGSSFIADSMAVKFHCPPVPDTYITGVVTSNETGQAVDSVLVDVGSNITYTNNAGQYSYYGALAGLTIVEFIKDGYNSAVFSATLSAGDTVTLNTAMEPMDIHSLYSSGFESGEDQGSTNAFAGTGSYAVVDAHITASGDTVLPASGVAMLVFPDSGGYANNDYIWWVADTAFDLTSSTGGLYFDLDMNIDTEEGYDFFRFCLMMDDGIAWYDSENGFVSGSTDGWMEHRIDMSWALNMGSATAKPVIIFDSDGGVTGSGGVFDNISVTWNPFFLAPPGPLSAVNYGSSVPLSWEEPAGSGRASYNVGSVDLNMSEPPSRPMAMDDNGNMVEQTKGPRNYPIVTMNYDYSTSSTRSLLGYNVYRATWPFGEPQLLTHVTSTAHDDAAVSEGSYYEYWVRAVYDEGESWMSGPVSARAGLPVVVTDDAYGGEDFESNDFAWENWEAFYSSDAAVWLVGDSAAADSSFGLGGVRAPNHSNFAYLSDGRGGDADFETFLLSPFIDFLDNFTAIVKLSGYAQVWGDFAENNIVRLLVRSDMGPWRIAVDFGYDHMNGWGDYSASIGNIVSSRDKAQFALHYTHTGGLNSGNGNGVAFDDLDFETIPGPYSLSATPTTTDITLSWIHPDSSRFRALPEPINISQNRATVLSAPSEETNINRTDCFSHGMTNSNWITGFYGPDSGSLVAPTFATLHAFNEGPMELEEVIIHGYYNTDDTTTANAHVFVGVADSSGVTVDTIATDEVSFDISNAGSWTTATIDLSGLIHNATDSTFLKVTWTPLNDGYIALFDANMWIPGQRIDDPNVVPANGLSGFDDSSGVYYPSATHNFVIEVCGTPTPPDMSYNVYKDYNLLAENIEATTLIDENVSAITESCYWVHGVVPKSFNIGTTTLNVLHETDPSNTACASLINTPPGQFNLITPPDGETVVIRPENIGETTLFAWSNSVDPNGYPVAYHAVWSAVVGSDSLTFDVDTAATYVQVSYQDMADTLMSYSGVETVTFQWTVFAHDQQSSTEASNGPRTVTFDIGYMLSNASEGLLPEVFALHQNYPNPFNPITTIRFDVPEESRVRIDIYNVMGQRVAELIDAYYQPGFHTVNWGGTNTLGSTLSSGMYFYRIQAKDFTAVKKLLLVK